MNGIIYFLKKELILAIIAFIVFIITFNLYRSQTTFNRVNDIEMLKNKIIKKKKKLKQIIIEYKKEKRFEEKIKDLKIIDEPISLDIYKEADYLSKVFYNFFGTDKIRVSYRAVALKFKNIKKYVFYKVTMEIPYINKYLIQNFFNFLNNRYFYIVQQVHYDTKKQTFSFVIYLLGKKGKSHHKRHMRHYKF
jgi:hypothetical protein